MTLRSLAALALLVSLASCVPSHSSLREDGHSATAPLRLASWNLEFLAERDGTGCEPRGASDYAGMRRIADSIDADVIAFQEAESLAAAARVFDPARYEIVMERREGKPSGACGGPHADQPFIRQAVGFAVRKGLAFDRNPDVTDLQLGNPQLRSAVDITLKPKGHRAIRLLSLHLKSGCFTGRTAKACPVLLEQIPALEAWIDRAAAGPIRFAVLGDWNRRLALPRDEVWADIDDGKPRNADLTLADEGMPPACDPRFDSFIDHIVLDQRAGASKLTFAEIRYANGEKHYSDHCPISLTLAD